MYWSDFLRLERAKWTLMSDRLRRSEEILVWPSNADQYSSELLAIELRGQIRLPS